MCYYLLIQWLDIHFSSFPQLFLGLVMLSSDLKNVFLEDQDCDVTIKAKNVIFKAHKVILKARSEVLSSMLTHDMAEKKSNVINIHDCEPEAFKIFLLYLYSGKAENLTETNVLHVYYIADKYNIPDLKAECVLYIKSSMSAKTICSIISLARKHDDSELLTCATDYFILNVHEVIHTEEWNLFIKDYPKYGNQLFLRAIKSRNVSYQSLSQN